MNPTQEAIDGALNGADMYKSRGPASFAQEDTIILAAAYRAAIARADSLERERDIFQKSAGIAMRQYAELIHHVPVLGHHATLLARHEAERKGE